MRANILLILLTFVASTVLASPPVESWKTPSGTKVMYVHAPELPMVDVRITFDAGSARDEVNPGIAVFTNGMLAEGAGQWSADEIATQLDNQGIRLGSGALKDMAWISFRSLTQEKALNTAVATASIIISQPTMAKKDLERVRQQILIAIRQSKQSPGSIAKLQFYEALFAKHPYAHDSYGEVDVVKALTKKELLAFHKKYYVAKNAVISIVGAVDKKQAEKIANQLVASLAKGEHAKALAKPVAAVKNAIRKPYPSTQSHIYVGQIGLTREDPDYFPLYVGNHVLGGGGLVSMLGEEVRNKRGLSYSVYSYFSPMRTSGPFLMVAQTKNKQVDEALEVMKATLADFIKNGPDEKHLEESKKNIMGGFPLQVASNKKIVEYISVIGFYDLPLDWMDSLVNKVAKVTAAQVKSAFARRVHPDKMLSVIVGGKE